MTYTATTAPYVEVKAAQGRVRGGHCRGALAFKGIPYAGAVTGAARFKEAPPPQPWSGVRDALAELKSAQPAPVWLYRYDYRSNTPIPGTDWTLRAGHATEIAMKFFNYDIPGLEGNGPGVAEASKNMSTLWTRFAHNSHPDVPGLPAWPRYDLKRRATMIIDVECRVADDPDREIREMWESLHR
jgi:carboxylesterase type B